MTTEYKEFLPPNNHVDVQYQALLNDILVNGVDNIDRTGTGTRKVFGRLLKVDLSQGHPLLTTKKVWFKGIVEELCWFLRGERNIRNLVQKGVHIWDEWPFQQYIKANELESKFAKYTPEWEQEKKVFITRVGKDEEFANRWGDLGPVYGWQWRHWITEDGKEVDQVTEALNLIKSNPQSRRIIINAWDAGKVERQALPPCHVMSQFNVIGDRLHCAMYQRSVDTFLGLPYNVSSYGLLTELFAKATGLKAGELTLFLGDTHLYLNHFDQAREQLKRDPRRLPQLELQGVFENLGAISADQLKLRDYNPHPAIPAPISV